MSARCNLRVSSIKGPRGREERMYGSDDVHVKQKVRQTPSQLMGARWRLVSLGLARTDRRDSQLQHPAVALPRRWARQHSPRMLVGIPSMVWSMSCTSRYRWMTYASSSSSTKRVGTRVSGETLCQARASLRPLPGSSQGPICQPSSLTTTAHQTPPRQKTLVPFCPQRRTGGFGQEISSLDSWVMSVACR